jgi:hypothetical protein
MQENLPFYYRHYLRMRNKHQCKAIKEKDNSGLHGWQQNHVPRERHRSLGGLTRWRHSPGGWPLAIMNAFHQHGETSTYDVALVLIHTMRKSNSSGPQNCETGISPSKSCTAFRTNRDVMVPTYVAEERHGSDLRGGRLAVQSMV